MRVLVIYYVNNKFEKVVPFLIQKIIPNLAFGRLISTAINSRYRGKDSFE